MQESYVSEEISEVFNSSLLMQIFLTKKLEIKCCVLTKNGNILNMRDRKLRKYILNERVYPLALDLFAFI